MQAINVNTAARSRAQCDYLGQGEREKSRPRGWAGRLINKKLAELMHSLIAIYSRALCEEINFAAHSATDSRKAKQVSCLASTDSYEAQLGHVSRYYGKKAHAHAHETYQTRLS